MNGFALPLSYSGKGGGGEYDVDHQHSFGRNSRKGWGGEGALNHY